MNLPREALRRSMGLGERERMNKWILLATVFAFALTGCQFMDRVGNAIYDPVVVTETYTTNAVQQVEKVITLSDGTTHTNIVDQLVEVPVTVTSTNSWVLNPGIENGIKLFGDVAPLPWAGTASWLATAVLGVGAHLMGRKYKKAAIEGVTVAMDARTRLKKHSPEESDAVKTAAVNRQRVTGTKTTIDSILALVK